MIPVLGDLHGFADRLRSADAQISDMDSMPVGIQVGDLGWYPSTIPNFKRLALKRKWYWVDGNHEYFPYLREITEVTEVAPNLFYVPRGTVLELDGRRVAFCGGAGSVDKQYRLSAGLDWHPEEEVTDADVEKFEGVKDIDLLVTHCPPQVVIERHFSRHDLLQFGLPVTWTDPSALRIEKIWSMLGQPPLVCGHMHRSVKDGNVRILNECGLYGV